MMTWNDETWPEEYAAPAVRFVRAREWFRGLFVHTFEPSTNEHMRLVLGAPLVEAKPNCRLIEE